MISKEDLRRIQLLENLSDDMLDKIVSLADVVEFNEGHIVYNEGDLAEKLYMLRRGKVLLEQRISARATVTVGTIDPGETLGLAAIMNERLYHAAAICSEKCKFFVISGQDLSNAFEQDYELGYKLMKKFSMILNGQLDRRTEQFLRAIRTHPDMREIGEVETENIATDKAEQDDG